ncbi:hypothetical protein BGZ96_000434 [Linnemannia gamsii]|uniref:Galactose oxidase n=1 Tax=Linnemannia gamsii TaxID=64522 RepID=A0ABQ7JPA1_9FUNG|nr:hypothetical protein BGZ96_000434 [Linnemannia gamsii]
MLHSSKASFTGAVITLALSLTLLTHTPPAHAQERINSASGAAYVRHENQFYVAGGGQIREIKDRNHYTEPQPIPGDGQFATLDLSQPWNASAPLWKKLSPAPKRMDFPVAMNADGTKLIAFQAGMNATETFALIYDCPSNTWKPSSIRVPRPDRAGLRAVLDPRKNMVYIAGGYENNDDLDQMYVYHWDTDQLTKKPMPMSAVAKTNQYKAVWWSTKSSILYFGGYYVPGPGFVKPTINVYNPDTDYWETSLQTTGPSPGERSDMCMAISDDGKKLVIFGGRFFTTFQQSIMSEMYILDLDTLVWTRGQDYATPRIYTTCTIVDGTFLSWGGTDTTATVNAPMIIYDIKRNKYLSQFKGPNPDKDFDPAAPPKPNSSGSGNNSQDKEMTWEERRNIIIGSICGAVVLFWTVIGCCFCRVQRNRARSVQEVLDASNRKIAEETARVAKRQTIRPLAATANRSSTTAAAGGPKSTNRSSMTVLPAAIPTPVQLSPGNQLYPLMQSPGSQPYPVMQPQGQVYPPLSQQGQGYQQSYPMAPFQHQHQPGQGSPQVYPMVPLQHQHQPGQGSPQVYPMLQLQEQHRLSKAAPPLPSQPTGGSPQVISSDVNNPMASPPPFYGSPYTPIPRGPEMISVEQSDYAESSVFAGSQTSFAGNNTPASGSAANLIHSPQQR